MERNYDPEREREREREREKEEWTGWTVRASYPFITSIIFIILRMSKLILRHLWTDIVLNSATAASS